MWLRTMLRATCAGAAVACISIAAYLAFDWADYGYDSTCGNVIRYKGAGPPCSEIIRNRVGVAAALLILAIALVASALRKPPKAS